MHEFLRIGGVFPGVAGFVLEYHALLGHAELGPKFSRDLRFADVRVDQSVGSAREYQNCSGIKAGERHGLGHALGRFVEGGLPAGVGDALVDGSAEHDDALGRLHGLLLGWEAVLERTQQQSRNRRKGDQRQRDGRGDGQPPPEFFTRREG
jgi:hypothetical protein